MIRITHELCRRAKLQGTVIPSTQNQFIGFAAKYAPSTGGVCSVEVVGVHAFDEGLAFYRRLSAFDDFAIAVGKKPGSVTRMLVISGQTETTVYADEGLPIVGDVRPKRVIQAGDPVSSDDIASVRRLEIPGLELNAPAGIMLLISVGWRRGMCFDFRAVQPKDPVAVTESIATVLSLGGMLMTHLLFTERFLLEEADWEKLIRKGWFPFVSLPHSLWEALTQAVANDDETDVAETAICEWIKANIQARMEFWAASAAMTNHMEFFNRAVQAFLHEDWITCVSLAVPRIEGVMRHGFGSWDNQKVLIQTVITSVSAREHPRSLLFPDRLREYFDCVVFPYTKFDSSDLPATRHTLSHGLVKAHKLTRQHAITTLLLIDHLTYCLPEKPKEP